MPAENTAGDQGVREKLLLDCPWKANDLDPLANAFLIV
jgi:hypothetical protein